MNIAEFTSVPNFSKPKVQKGIPRPKRLVSTTAETKQPIIRDTAEEPRRKGEVRRVKRRKKGGEAAQETERIQDSQPDGTVHMLISKRLNRFR
jgi:hypothetical protein